MRMIVLVFAFLFLLTGAMLLSAHLCAEDDILYFFIQERIGLISGEEGLETDIVMKVNLEITDYLKGSTNDIIGVSGKAFLHMEDVRRLLGYALYASYASFFLSCACFLLAGRRKTLARGAAYAFFPVLIVCLIPVFKRIDFHGLFIAFHEIAFDNDYWLLDPVEDMLIRLLPESFFSMMAFEIIKRGLLFYLVVGLGAVLAAAVLYRRRKDELL